MIEDLINQIAVSHKAEQVIEAAEELASAFRVREAVAMLDAALADNPEDVDLVDQVFRLKCMHLEFSACETLNRKYRELTGEDHPLYADALSVVREQQVADAPAQADVVFDYLQAHSQGIALIAIANGLDDGKFATFITLGTDEATLESMNGRVRELLAERFPSGAVSFVLVSTERSVKLCISGKLQTLAARGVDVDDMLRQIHEQLTSHGIDPNSALVYEALSQFCDVLLEQTAQDQPANDAD